MQKLAHIAVIGAGASGLMCAFEAACRGLRVALIDHRRDFGRKLAVSGGGRCNFTNLRMDASSFLSANPHFVKSALAGYRPSDFTALLDEHGIGYREEAEGRLFLKGTGRTIIDMLAKGAQKRDCRMVTGAPTSIKKGKHFQIKGGFGEIEADKVVVATGGLSYPELGASDLGYRIAKQFGHRIIPCRPALVPLLFGRKDHARFSMLSGVSFRARVSVAGTSMEDDCLITHRGLSGPAILRISAHWKKGGALVIDPLPGVDTGEELEALRSSGSRMQLKTAIARWLPPRLAEALCCRDPHPQPLCSYSKKSLRRIAHSLHEMRIVPTGTEGYATAEVTAGGVDTRGISSKTMESAKCPGLYFIGEVLDATGDLGGYNLHWAWASGHAAANSF